MSVLAALATALVTVAILCPTGPARAAAGRVVDGKAGDWRGITTRLGGTWRYSRGELVYQDHIYDDLGADTRQRSEQHGNTGAPAGDYRYPADEKRYGNNAADVLELRLAADRESLWVLARMNTLKVRDGTVVAIAMDTDRKVTTGGGAWPHGAGLSVDGADKVITLWGAEGTITSLPDGKPVPIHDVAVDTSNENNAIEARIPRALIGTGSKLRVWAASGLWDPAASGWMAVPSGSPTATAPGGGSAIVPARAFNIAFRPDETGSYMEERQGAALAAGNIAPFHADVDVAALMAGRSSSFRVKPRRFYAVVMDQRLSIPPYNEGLSYAGIPGRFAGVGGAALDQTFNFYGRHQPYGLYVPSTFGRKTRIPAALVLHGLGGSHSSYNSQPGFLADMGEGKGTGHAPMFLITPLGRGSSFYADWGEADTLAVLRDVFARFPIDDDRLYLTGYSMGGYGVYRLGTLYPDRFAAAAAWAGYTGEFLGSYLTDPRWITGDPAGQYDEVAAVVRQAIAPAGVGGGRMGKANIGDPVDALENLRHLPLAHLAGTNDQIVPTPGQFAGPRRLAELGYRSRFDLYPGYEHLTFAIVDDWKQVRAWLGNRTRERSPREITYKFSDGWTAPGLARKLELVHGNVWWLRDLKMRKTTDDALALVAIHAVSHAVAARTRTVLPSDSVAEAPTPHVQRLVSWAQGRALPLANKLDVDMTGIGTATIDAASARVHPCGLVISLRSDGPATLKINGSVPRSARATGVRDVAKRVERNSLVLTIKKATTGNLSVGCS